MIPKKNLKDLKLTEEQKAIYKELEYKEQLVRSSLKRCGVNRNVIEKIVNVTDLTKVTDDETLLDETIKETWGDLITEKR